MYSDKDRILETLVTPVQTKASCQQLGISYHPVQNANWNRVYDAETALVRGTIFPELDLPYLGKGRARK